MLRRHVHVVKFPSGVGTCKHWGYPSHYWCQSINVQQAVILSKPTCVPIGCRELLLRKWHQVATGVILPEDIAWRLYFQNSRKINSLLLIDINEEKQFWGCGASPHTSPLYVSPVYPLTASCGSFLSSVCDIWFAEPAKCSCYYMQGAST